MTVPEKLVFYYWLPNPTILGILKSQIGNECVFDFVGV
jgi:hypothetical protein